MSSLAPPYVTHAGNFPLYLNNNPVVQSLQALTGPITLTSPDSSVTINPSGQSIQLQVTAPSSGVTSVNLVTGAVSLASPGDTISFSTAGQNINAEVQGIPAGIAVAGLNTLTDSVTLTSPDSSITITTVGQDIQLQAVAPPATTVYQATYYKTTAQNLTSGNTDITFDAVGSWNNDGGYITHVAGTTAFTVVQTGLYQLEFNVVVQINGGSWTNVPLSSANKTCNIDITRPSIAEQGILSTTGLQGSQNYGQSVNGTFYLVAGDVLNMRVGNIFTVTGVTPPQAQCLQNTFDLNTFFTWTFIS
jgi:hypothetical protein